MHISKAVAYVFQDESRADKRLLAGVISRIPALRHDPGQLAACLPDGSRLCFLVSPYRRLISAQLAVSRGHRHMRTRRSPDGELVRIWVRR